MPTLAEVKQQIANYPHTYVFWTGKEIKALPKILERDEPVKALTSGLMNNATWLLVCTDRRVVFLNCGMFFGVQQASIPLDRIQSIDYNFTIYYGSITVRDAQKDYTLGMISRASILPFIKTTEELMYKVRKAHGQPVPEAPPANAPMDVTTQLLKLAELREKGHLTEAEFADQKRRLLAR